MIRTITDESQTSREGIDGNSALGAGDFGFRRADVKDGFVSALGRRWQSGRERGRLNCFSADTASGHSYIGPTASQGSCWTFCNLAGRALTLLAVRDFLAIDLHLAGRIDTEPHLMALDGHDGDFDVVSDVDDFANSARQNQHESCSGVLGRFSCHHEGGLPGSCPLTRYSRSPTAEALDGSRIRFGPADLAPGDDGAWMPQ